MNFLAHIFLSENIDEVMIGNFIADFIKGSQWKNQPPNIITGILLHRAIDNFTDTHPLFAEGRKRLYPTFSKYAGVIMDIYYDHLLAKHWENFSEIPLQKFSAEVYQFLEKNTPLLPEKTQQLLPYMMQQDWLYHYQDLDFLHETFLRLQRRIAIPLPMEKAVPLLSTHQALLEQEFTIFFPEAILFAQNFLAKSTIA